MKYFETLIEDQETTISILYQEQKIRVYSSEPKTVQRLSKVLGKPTKKYLKSKTYWSGASWDIDFFDLEKIQPILSRDVFIDKKVKPIAKEENKKTKTILKSEKKKIKSEPKEKIEKKNAKSELKEKIEKKNAKSGLKEKIEKKKIKSKQKEKLEKKKTKSELKDQMQKKKGTAKIEKKKQMAKTKKKKAEAIKFEQIQFSF